MPIAAPKPFVMSMKSPCALERFDGSTSLSTNSDPEMLKKSNATPYTIIESVNANSPGMTGDPIPNSPNRKNQADIEIIITALMPYRFKKNGINKMHSVSDTCESEISKLACPAKNASLYSSKSPKDNM